MARERSSKTDAQNQAEYAHAWARFQAGECGRPIYHEYHLAFGDAVMLQQVVNKAIENAYTEPEGDPPDPAKYGVDPERAQELDEEIVRLCKKAYDRRRHPDG